MLAEKYRREQILLYYLHMMFALQNCELSEYSTD